MIRLRSTIALLAEFFGGLLGRARPVVPTPVVKAADADPATEPSTAEPAPPEPEPEPATGSHAREPLSDPKLAAFFHTRARVRERYGFTLHQNVWTHWIKMIQTNHALALSLGQREGGGELWYLDYGPMPVFVVYRDGLIITALPNENGKFDHLLAFHRSEVERRRKKAMPLKTGKTSSKQVGKGILPPPKRRRP